jgi:hypothetical protein
MLSQPTTPKNKQSLILSKPDDLDRTEHQSATGFRTWEPHSVDIRLRGEFTAWNAMFVRVGIAAAMTST